MAHVWNAKTIHASLILRSLRESTVMHRVLAGKQQIILNSMDVNSVKVLNFVLEHFSLDIQFKAWTKYRMLPMIFPNISTHLSNGVAISQQFVIKAGAGELIEPKREIKCQTSIINLCSFQFELDHHGLSQQLQSLLTVWVLKLKRPSICHHSICSHVWDTSKAAGVVIWIMLGGIWINMGEWREFYNILIILTMMKI